jgi:type IV pilus assembly protein PilB
MARKRLGEILLAAGVIDEGRLRAALAEQRRWGGPLGRILIDMGAVSEEAMVSALSHQLNFPTINLDERNIALDVIDLVPVELAEQHSVIPFAVQSKFLDVAMADPTNLGIVDELRIRTRLNVRPYLAGPKMIERALSKYYGRGIAVGLGAASGTASVDGIALGPAVGATSAAMPANTRMIDPGEGMPSTSAPSTPSATARRAGQFDLGLPAAAGTAPADRDREIASLQARVQHLEALVARDEDVLRKLMGLLIEKGLTSREEILERIK